MSATPVSYRGSSKTQHNVFTYEMYSAFVALESFCSREWVSVSDQNDRDKTAAMDCRALRPKAENPY